MIRKNVVLVLILCATCFQIGLAQSHRKIDSLLVVLKTAKEDTLKVKTLNGVCTEKTNIGEYEDAKNYAERALVLAQKLGFKRGMAKSYIQIGNADLNLSDYYKALENYQKAVTVNEQMGNKSWIAINLTCIGNVYNLTSDYPKALEYYQKALAISEQLDNKASIALNLGNIGSVYGKFDYQKALEYSQKSLKIYEQMGNKDGIASMLTNIGSIYCDNLHEYQKALENMQKAITIYEQLGNTRSIAINLGNIGEVYNQLSDYNKSLEYLNKALKIDIEIGDKNQVAIVNLSIGTVYQKQGKLNEALNVYKNALSLALETGDLYDIKTAYENISAIDSAMNNFKDAYQNSLLFILYNDSIFNMEKDKKLTQLQMNYDFNKVQDSSKAEQAKKDAITHSEIEKQKLHSALMSKDYEDSLTKKENKERLTEMSMQFEFDKKQSVEKLNHDNLMTVANVEIKKQKVLKYSSIGGLFIVLILSYLGYRIYRSRQLIRLQAIRNKISSDLHDDIGSTLNSISIYSEVAKQKSPVVVHELDQIGIASRKIIEGMSDIVWTINPENDSFENIIDRMRSHTYNILRAKNIEFTFRADEKLNEQKLSLEDRRNFYLIFKEVLNNMVKYSEATRASITLNSENNRITLLMSDNGKGFDTSATANGNGLNNIRRRAKEMKADLTIESSLGNGTRTELKFR